MEWWHKEEGLVRLDKKEIKYHKHTQFPYYEEKNGSRWFTFNKERYLYEEKFEYPFKKNEKGEKYCDLNLERKKIYYKRIQINDKFKWQLNGKNPSNLLFTWGIRRFSNTKKIQGSAQYVAESIKRSIKKMNEIIHNDVVNIDELLKLDLLKKYFVRVEQKQMENYMVKEIKETQGSTRTVDIPSSFIQPIPYLIMYLSSYKPFSSFIADVFGSYFEAALDYSLVEAVIDDRKVAKLDRFFIVAFNRLTKTLEEISNTKTGFFHKDFRQSNVSFDKCFRPTILNLKESVDNYEWGTSMHHICRDIRKWVLSLFDVKELASSEYFLKIRVNFNREWEKIRIEEEKYHGLSEAKAVSYKNGQFFVITENKIPLAKYANIAVNVKAKVNLGLNKLTEIESKNLTIQLFELYRDALHKHLLYMLDKRIEKIIGNLLQKVKDHNGYLAKSYKVIMENEVCPDNTDLREIIEKGKVVWRGTYPDNDTSRNENNIYNPIYYNFGDAEELSIDWYSAMVNPRSEAAINKIRERFKTTTQAPYNIKVQGY